MKENIMIGILIGILVLIFGYAVNEKFEITSKIDKIDPIEEITEEATNDLEKLLKNLGN